MRFRSAFSALAAAAVGAGVLSAAVPAQAVSSPPYYAKVVEIPAAAPKAMREANGHLFVSTENSVLVLSETGLVETTLTGMYGASGMTTSPDGATLYVALSGSGDIAVIDTTSLTVTATWAASDCVDSLALSGTVMFYGAGCSGSDTIGAISVTDGSALDTGASETYVSPLMLEVAGTTLLVADSNDGLFRYDISDSTLQLGSAEPVVMAPADIAVSPDGTAVGTASSSTSQIATRDPADLSQNATFATGPYPTAVAFSHDGTRIAGGLWQPYDDELYVYDRTTGSKVVSGYVRAPTTDTVVPIVSDTLAFSADDSRLFGIAQEFGATTSYLAMIATESPAQTTAVLTVTSPKRVGGEAVAVVDLGAADLPVTVTVTSVGRESSHKVTTNAAGVARYTWKPKYSGTVSATFKGDLLHLGATSATKSYRAPSSISVRMSAPYKRTGAVLHYHSATDVASVATVRPGGVTRYVTAWLMALHGGRWVRMDSLSLITNSHSSVYVRLTSGSSHTQYKFRYQLKNDYYNVGTTTDSPRFVLD